MLCEGCLVTTTAMPQVQSLINKTLVTRAQQHWHLDADGIPAVELVPTNQRELPVALAR